MTTQPTYIYSDAECVLHWMKDHPIDRNKPGYIVNPASIEQAKSTAVRFADQNAVSLILLYDLEISLIQRNTIYTVEGYGVDSEWKNTKGPCNYPCGPDDFTPDGICGEKGCCVELATLKRIEPVVEQENAGWDKVYDHYKRDLEKYGSLDGGYSEWLKIKYHAPKPINPPKQ